MNVDLFAPLARSKFTNCNISTSSPDLSLDPMIDRESLLQNDILRLYNAYGGILIRTDRYCGMSAATRLSHTNS